MKKNYEENYYIIESAKRGVYMGFVFRPANGKYSPKFSTVVKRSEGVHFHDATEAGQAVNVIGGKDLTIKPIAVAQTEENRVALTDNSVETCERRSMKVDVCTYDPKDFHPKVVAAVRKLKHHDGVNIVVVSRTTEFALTCAVEYATRIATRLGLVLGVFTCKGADIGMEGAEMLATYQYHFVYAQL